MAELTYGLDADLKAKQDAKYDHELEAQVVAWIEAITGQSKGDAPIAEWLHDGKVLCALVNAIKPGSVKKVNEQAMPFKQMENITNFMHAIRDIGVPESAMFGTPDLYEDKNMGTVICAINTFGGAVQVNCPDFAGPKLGVPLSVASKDKKRAGGIATQSGGLSGTLEQQKVDAGRRELGSSPRPGTSPRPAGASPRPEGASPRPAGEAGVPRDDCTYGLDADLKAKRDAKYDSGLEKDVCDWIEAVTGQAKGDATAAEWLKSGEVLCALANAVKPGVIKKVNAQKMPFKQMENITFFMNAAREVGVPEALLFGTPDLYEEKNMMTVFSAIYTFGGAVQTSCPDFSGPKLGNPLTQDGAGAADRKRAGVAADRSGGMHGVMEVERPVQGMKR